jgi:hypothetical protein
MKSLISLTYGGHLYLSNVTFTENFLFEPSFSLRERSLLIFISQFKGQIDLKKVKVQTIKGLNTDWVK